MLYLSLYKLPQEASEDCCLKSQLRERKHDWPLLGNPKIKLALIQSRIQYFSSQLSGLRKRRETEDLKLDSLLSFSGRFDQWVTREWLLGWELR